jgi:hypothetical protein
MVDVLCSKIDERNSIVAQDADMNKPISTVVKSYANAKIDPLEGFPENCGTNAIDETRHGWRAI